MMVAASIRPTPGTLRNSATFSRQRGLERMVLFSSSSSASTRTWSQAMCSSRSPHESLSALVADGFAGSATLAWGELIA